MHALKLLLSVTIICLLRLGQVENKAFFGIGRRINGDQLLLKDVQQSRPATFDERSTVHFNYRIEYPIDYIEIISEQNVLAEVNFSYHHNLVVGTVSAVNGTAVVLKPFEVIISIYGFTEPLNVHRSLILNRDQHFRGTLQPFPQNRAESLLEEDAEAAETFDERGNLPQQVPNIAIEEEASEEQQDIEADFEHADEVIAVGNRQRGDYLIYETLQTSPAVTDFAENHSVVFYYIDRNYITAVTFRLFDFYNNKAMAKAPIVHYSYLSPTTLKAVIMDPETTSLFVQMRVYGYNHNDLPTTYESFPPNTRLWQQGHNDESADSPLFPMQQLQKLLQASATPQADETDSSNLLPLSVQHDAQGRVQLVSADKSVVCKPSGGIRSAPYATLTKVLIAPLLGALCARLSLI